ncbi:MAG TPA: methyltransferase domain-containing protein [Acidimicrobiales bacterium]|nr:methyltransferase domain-containing protein [Acidimicrobiales bacterium]
MSDAPSAVPLGFAGVDHMPDPAVLVRAMDETGTWPATQELRRQAITWLHAGNGRTFLDIGCGPGDAAIALAEKVGPGGRVVGIDASQVMVDEATTRAEAAAAAAEFRVGDAQNLEFADDTFDGCRSERTLQWVDSPETALAEFKRVTRPGGTVVVIDTDWGTFAPYHPDPQLTQRVQGAIFGRRPGFVIGRSLRSLFVKTGLDDVRVRAATHLIPDWDPTARPGPPGFPPFAMILQGISESGAVSEKEALTWIQQLEQTARDGHFCASLTMFAVAGRKPA